MGYAQVPKTEQYRDSEDGTHSNDGLLEKVDISNSTTYKEPFWKKTRFLFTFHVALFGVYIMILAGVLSIKTADIRSKGLPYSPAVEALEYREQHLALEGTIQDRADYVGKPSPALDAAWHDLLDAENIMIEPEYMRYYGREDLGVAIPEGGGYIATLNVYHEIHCLKRLHQFMYPDYYFPDFTPHQHEMNRLHNEHCIDFLRQSAMCHGDIGLLTFEWHSNSRIPVANATTHQCVNWEKLDKWTRDRTVNMLKPGWLVHPTMGVAYPDGQGDKLGAVDPHDGH